MAPPYALRMNGPILFKINISNFPLSVKSNCLGENRHFMVIKTELGTPPIFHLFSRYATLM